MAKFVAIANDCICWLRFTLTISTFPSRILNSDSESSLCLSITKANHNFGILVTSCYSLFPLIIPTIMIMKMAFVFQFLFVAYIILPVHGTTATMDTSLVGSKGECKQHQKCSLCIQSLGCMWCSDKVNVKLTLCLQICSCRMSTTKLFTKCRYPYSCLFVEIQWLASFVL